MREFSHRDKLVIDILSQETREDIVYETDKIYDNIFILKVRGFLNKFRVLRAISKQIVLRRVIKTLPTYDYVHIQYIEDILSRDAKFIATNLKAKIIVSIWGSDFFQASKRKKTQIIPLLKEAKIITIINKSISKDFRDFYKGYNLEDKIQNLFFGLAPLEHIKEKVNLINSKESNRANWGFSKDKILITIGYNAREEQQHLKIISSFENSDEFLKIKDKVEFILPLTYPNNVSYKKKIKEKIFNSRYNYRLIEDYMSDEMVASLRCATDFMIQVPTCDMMSGSMLENLASKAIVIVGDWLPYDELEKMDLFFEKVQQVDELPNKIIISLGVDLKRVTEKNFEIVYNTFNWRTTIKKWDELYK